MSKQFQPPFPITIPMEDTPLHGTWNNYYCFDISCPCHDNDTMWTGALWSIERDTMKRQAVAKQSDDRPTDILAPMPPQLEETYRLAVARRRKHRNIFKRLLHKMTGK